MPTSETLTLRDIAGYRGQGDRGSGGGTDKRFYCPVHGGDNQRSLVVNMETGLYCCHACNAKGVLGEYRQHGGRISDPHKLPLALRGSPTAHQAGVIASREPQVRDDYDRLVYDYWKAMKGSYGEEYLKRRGIPLEVADLYCIGYAAPGQWGNKNRDWKFGRLTFPHQTPWLEAVNIYGRAVGSNDKVPKEIRHDHLPGPKGIFNAAGLLGDDEGRTFICEGAFDAMSMIAAGHTSACAVFGLNGLYWPWVKARRIVFCFDQDDAGKTAWKQLAKEAAIRGKEVFWLGPETYRGHKDLNEVWLATGKIEIGGFPDMQTDKALVYS